MSSVPRCKYGLVTNMLDNGIEPLNERWNLPPVAQASFLRKRAPLDIEDSCRVVWSSRNDHVHVFETSNVLVDRRPARGTSGRTPG